MQARGLNVHVIVGEHEAYALVLAKGASKGLARARIFRGNVVCSPRLAQPAHAMRQTGRRQSDLSIFKTTTDLAQNIRSGDADILELHDAMTTRKAAVHRIHLACHADSFATHVRQEHRGGSVFHFCHDDDVTGSLGASDEPFGAVDDVVVAVLDRCCQHH